MKTYQALDFLNLDDQLSSDERMIRDSVRQFISREVMPIIESCHREGRFPKELVKGFADLGVFGPTIQGYGCAGLNQTSYGLIMQEIERGDSGLRSFVSVQGALCMYPIYKFGTDEQKNKFLPKMAKGEFIGCFGLTEPDFGSNPAGLITRAKDQGDHYILNGTKMWITNGCIADLAIVWAKNDDGKIIGLIVEKSFAGFKTKEIKNKYSLRASVTSELIFEDVKVPKKNQLEVTGLKGPFACLNQARYGIAWGATGSAMACFDEAVNYSKTRIQFDRPIGGFQLVQAKLVHMLSEITRAQLLNHRLGRMHESNAVEPHHISLAKMNNVSMALNIARTTRDILGANGITDEYQCGRHMANLESVNTYEGTEDIHRLILGQHITGIPAFT